MRRFLTAALPIVAATTMMPFSPRTLMAQDSMRATRRDTTPPPFDFSGILFANYQYGGVKGNRITNRFDIDRAYLTFRATPGKNFGVRITGDVFQQRDTTRDQYYRGWTLRAKYAYGQYDFIRGSGDALKANVRLGLVQTVIIDYEEQFWIRGLAQVALEQTGSFASADAGAAATLTLPKKYGELYATIVNGSGYTSRETDRFKDYAARLTLTPLANTHSYLKGLSISPWYYKGDRASDFARRQGTVQAVTSAQRKDRGGLFLALKDPRVTLGAQLAWRWDVAESADTTRDLAPIAVDRTGRLTSVYAIVRPLAFASGAPNLPIAVVLRADNFTADTERDPYQRNYIAGLSWEFNPRTSITFDYQNQSPRDGSTAVDSKVYFIHLIAGF